MVTRPAGLGAFEFAIVAGLRAAQLTRGCTSRVGTAHKTAVTAQMEVAQAKVVRSADAIADKHR